MGCYMFIIIAMYILMFHHYVIVESPVNSMLSHHGVRHVLEEFHGIIL